MGIYRNGQEYTKVYRGGMEQNGILFAGEQYLAAPEPSLKGVATRIGTLTGLSGAGGMASHGGTLYLAGQAFFGRVALGRFYTVDPETAALTRVGNLNNFGAGFNNPTGLVSHNGTLYIIGTNDFLFELNATTGQASNPGGRVIDVSRQDNNPRGLASGLFPGTPLLVIYMAGAQKRALFYLSPPSTAVTRIGSATEFGLEIDTIAGMTFHDGKLHLLGGITQADFNIHYSLFEVDRTTGVATKVGTSTNLGVAAFNSAESLASHDGTLYATGYDAAGLSLYSIA